MSGKKIVILIDLPGMSINIREPLLILQDSISQSDKVDILEGECDDISSEIGELLDEPDTSVADSLNLDIEHTSGYFLSSLNIFDLVDYILGRVQIVFLTQLIQIIVSY